MIINTNKYISGNAGISNCNCNIPNIVALSLVDHDVDGHRTYDVRTKELWWFRFWKGKSGGKKI